MTTGITNGGVATTVRDTQSLTSTGVLPREAVLLVGEKLVTNVLDNGGSYPLSISIGNVWYVFTDQETYEPAYSQTDANQLVERLRATVLSQR